MTYANRPIPPSTRRQTRQTQNIQILNGASLEHLIPGLSSLSTCRQGVSCLAWVGPLHRVPPVTGPSTPIHHAGNSNRANLLASSFGKSPVCSPVSACSPVLNRFMYQVAFGEIDAAAPR